MIGNHVTAAAITAGSESSYVDYRTDSAALDFVITPAGDWVLLEINPAGQYGFIENATAAPLTEQLAELLTGGAA